MKPAVSATDLILRLIEHEVPKYGLVHLLDLPQERLEIIEIEIQEQSFADGQEVQSLGLPDGSLVGLDLKRMSRADADPFVPQATSRLRILWTLWRASRSREFGG